MNKIVSLISIIICLTTSGFSQESSFYDAPFGVGIGYTPFWLIPKVGELNSQLKSAGYPQISTSGVYASGFGGFIYLGVIKNFRIGGMGFGGSTSSSLSGSSEQEAIYSLSGGGVTLEYTLPFIKAFALSVGAIIGGGSMQIQVYKNNGSMSWNSLWQNAAGSSEANINKTLKNSYWIVTPTLNIDIPAYRLLSFRVGLGYQYTFGEKWTYDNSKNFTGVPSNINGNGFLIQAGILIGLFSY